MFFLVGDVTVIYCNSFFTDWEKSTLSIQHYSQRAEKCWAVRVQNHIIGIR